jgi:hypothetical protein
MKNENKFKGEKTMDEVMEDDKATTPERRSSNSEGTPRAGDGQNQGGVPRHFPAGQVKELELIREGIDRLNGVKKGTKRGKARQTSNPRPGERQAYKPKPPFWFTPSCLPRSTPDSDAEKSSALNGRT